jgi:hypothetical protein
MHCICCMYIAIFLLRQCCLLLCMQVYYATVSAHADAKGILQLVQQVAPAAALLVHGEPDKMSFMSNKIQASLGIQCFMPAIGEEVEISSSSCTPVPTSAQLLRKLPMTVQQLMATRNVSEGSSERAAQGAAAAEVGISGQSMSAGAAAAGWLQQGDVGQLVQAAMKLAGLNAPAAAAAGGSSAGNAQQQQQQQLPVSAAARAAQLAPWLELLAAAAHEVRQGPGSAQEAQQQQQQPHIQPQQQQQADQQIGSVDPAVPLQQQQQQELPAGRLLPDGPSVATLSQQLHQQLALESQSCVLDGVLVVHHLPPKAPAEQQLVHSMQLLPAQDAAAALGLTQHTVRLKCRLKMPAGCWDQSAVQQWLQSAEGVGARIQQQVQQQQQQQLLSQAGVAGLGFVAAVLRTGLPASLAQQVQYEGASVRLSSVCMSVSESEPRTMMCSWLLHDDALAQQCVSVVESAAESM